MVILQLCLNFLRNQFCLLWVQNWRALWANSYCKSSFSVIWAYWSISIKYSWNLKLEGEIISLLYFLLHLKGLLSMKWGCTNIKSSQRKTDFQYQIKSDYCCCAYKYNVIVFVCTTFYLFPSPLVLQSSWHAPEYRHVFCSNFKLRFR